MFKKLFGKAARCFNNGHELVYYEIAVGYMAKCTQCNRHQSYMPGFRRRWKEVKCSR